MQRAKRSKNRWQCSIVIKAKDLDTKTELNAHTFIMYGKSAETVTGLFSKICSSIDQLNLKLGFRTPSKQNRTVLEEGLSGS
jgi:hypothetical protein